MSSSLLSLVIAGVLGLLCCTGAALLFFLAVGIVLLRRRGKKQISTKEAVRVGAEEVSRAFVRTKKTREELYAEEEEEDRRGPK